MLLNVRTFLERIEALSQQGTEESNGALALLEQRGLSKEILNEGAALIESVTNAQETASVPSGDEIKTTKENREAAIAEMWCPENLCRASGFVCGALLITGQ